MSIFCVLNLVELQFRSNLLADYYGKIPHNELITIAKVQCT